MIPTTATENDDGGSKAKKKKRERIAFHAENRIRKGSGNLQMKRAKRVKG